MISKPVIIVVTTLILMASCTTDCMDTAANLRDITFSGVVTDKVVDKSDFAQLKLQLEGAFLINTYNSDCNNFVHKGDFITKGKGTLKYIVIRDGDSTVFYPYCGQAELTDDLLEKL